MLSRSRGFSIAEVLAALLVMAVGIIGIASLYSDQVQSNPELQLQLEAATLADQIANRTKATDANDMIYYFRASEDYNPAPHVAKITAPLLAINSADDFVNPPELAMMETLIQQVPKGRFILLPITDHTRGHGTHTLPAIWGEQVRAFLESVRGR